MLSFVDLLSRAEHSSQRFTRGELDPSDDYFVRVAGSLGLHRQDPV
jgi:hypothetical protein